MRRSNKGKTGAWRNTEEERKLKEVFRERKESMKGCGGRKREEKIVKEEGERERRRKRKKEQNRKKDEVKQNYQLEIVEKKFLKCERSCHGDLGKVQNRDDKVNE